MDSKIANSVFCHNRLVSNVLGIFNYLEGVDLPTADVENKLVPMTYHHDGRPFDWRHVTIAMINVKTAQFQPTDAYASVRYRNHWFYIADCDFESKETLDLLAIITGIYQGNIKSYLPVFTVS